MDFSYLIAFESAMKIEQIHLFIDFITPMIEDYSFFIAVFDFSIDVEYNAEISSQRLRVMPESVMVFSQNVNQIRRSLEKQSKSMEWIEEFGIT